MDIASLSLDEIIIKLNKEDGSCTSNGKSLFIRAKQLMTAENKLRAKAYADHLFMVMEEQGKAAMFKDYIKNPKYSAISIKQDNKTGKYKIVERSMEMLFTKLERQYQIYKSSETDEKGRVIPDKSETIANDSKWKMFFNMLVDNIYRLQSGEIGPVVSGSKLEQEQRERYGFRNVSISALEIQMNKVVAAILPEDMPVKLIKIHVKYLLSISAYYRDNSILNTREGILMCALIRCIDSSINRTRIVLKKFPD